MEAERLLIVYAMAVANMREWQKTRDRAFPPHNSPYIEELEREVDELTALHLLPTPPTAPAVVEGGAK